MDNFWSAERVGGYSWEGLLAPRYKNAECDGQNGKRYSGNQIIMQKIKIADFGLSKPQI